MDVTDEMIRRATAIGYAEAIAAAKRPLEEKDEILAALSALVADLHELGFGDDDDSPVNGAGHGLKDGDRIAIAGDCVDVICQHWHALVTITGFDPNYAAYEANRPGCGGASDNPNNISARVVQLAGTSR